MYIQRSGGPSMPEIFHYGEIYHISHFLKIICFPLVPSNLSNISVCILMSTMDLIKNNFPQGGPQRASYKLVYAI